jgi:hypothetical protein
MAAAVHEVFEVRPRYKKNQEEFLFVVESADVPREILEHLLQITDTEFEQNLLIRQADPTAAAAADDWLRYKATILCKVLAMPGNFSFLKYSRRTGPPYWLLNVLYQAVESIDAWSFLRTLVSSDGHGLLLSQTPTMEQLEKIVSSCGVFYTRAEFDVALKTMVYIARNGWSRYLWR